jgi:hypothetical protein
MSAACSAADQALAHPAVTLTVLQAAAAAAEAAEAAVVPRVYGSKDLRSNQPLSKPTAAFPAQVVATACDKTHCAICRPSICLHSSLWVQVTSNSVQHRCTAENLTGVLQHFNKHAIKPEAATAQAHLAPAGAAMLGCEFGSERGVRSGSDLVVSLAVKYVV